MFLTSQPVVDGRVRGQDSRRRCDDVGELQVGRAKAQGWSRTIIEAQRRQAACAFIATVLDEYASLAPRLGQTPIKIERPEAFSDFALEPAVARLAREVGRNAATLPIEQACFQISTTYTAMVPSATRSALGMYYTPPALTERLLDMAGAAGIDWRTARVLDPACGGGAFLLPVARRIRSSLSEQPAAEQLRAISDQLCGFEIDPFAAWLTETWLEMALADLTLETGKRLPKLVRVCDTLNRDPEGELFDLVIGNPPYGRTRLDPLQRQRFSRSLYGHANLYGLFTDIALRWTKPGGVIAFVTPTSFLGGEYFKSLRALLMAEAPPTAVDFIEARRGVFEDVLQETLLATYERRGRANGTAVHYLSVATEINARITQAGHFQIPAQAAAPWIAPRRPEHQRLVDRMVDMPHRLQDWGYRVSTGPLVWNRFKDRLRTRPGKNIYPLIWAEAVAAPGQFVHRAEKRNHQPYFEAKAGDDWLKVRVPCVLVQRTTAKEQSRRLISAELPARFIEEHGAAIVENHLNMVRASGTAPPKVSTVALSAVLNSAVVDQAFRCINGSVAVSAFELEALPLPAPEHMAELDILLHRRASASSVEALIADLYLGKAAE